MKLLLFLLVVYRGSKGVQLKICLDLRLAQMIFQMNVSVQIIPSFYVHTVRPVVVVNIAVLLLSSDYSYQVYIAQFQFPKFPVSLT